jgi:hypothetical protein
MIELKQRQLEDLQLIEAIADPNTPESVWVPACLSFGETPIAPNELVISKFWQVMNNMLAATCATWSVAIAFMSCQIIIVLILKTLTGQPGPWDASHGVGFESGVRFALLSAIPFWSTQFQGTAARNFAWCAVSFVFLFMSLIAIPGIPGIFIGMTELSLLYFLAEKVLAIGEWFRASTPQFLRKSKMAAAASPMIWVVFYAAIIICVGFISFIPADLNMFLLPITALLLTVSWPAFVMAKLSKSKSMAASGAFGLIMQTPLIAGLLVGAAWATLGAILCAIPGGIAFMHYISPENTFDTLQQSVALTKSFLMFDMALVVAGLSIAGGYFGAWLNRVKASTPRN